MLWEALLWVIVAAGLAGTAAYLLRRRGKGRDGEATNESVGQVFTLVGGLQVVLASFLLIGVLGVWMFLGFSHYVVFMLSPFLAPFVVPWAARTQERLADRAAAELGYGVLLAEVFTGRELERAQQWQAALRQDL